MSTGSLEEQYRAFDAFVLRWDTLVLTSHKAPDADATGSEYGLLKALSRRGKKAVILNSDEPEAKFTYFQTEPLFHTLAETELLPRGEFGLIIVDTGDLDHLGAAAEVLIPRSKEVFVIDHHNVGRAWQIYPALVDVNAAATAEIVYEIYQRWGLDIPTDVAFALFTGLVFDTGSFVYPKTSEKTFAIAKHLMELGVRPKEVHSQLYEQLTPQRLMLLAEVQAGFELLENSAIAVQTVTQEILKRTGASLADTDNMINYPLKCTTVKISVFFKELENGTTKVSLRSKMPYDVGKFAHEWGGGGHINASGFTHPEGLAQTKEKVLQSLREFLHSYPP